MSNNTTQPEKSDTFISTFSQRTYPTSERMDIIAYGPIAVTEAVNNPAVFTKAYNEPYGPLYCATQLSKAWVGETATRRFVTAACTWPKDSNGNFIQPEFSMDAFDARGRVVHFHKRHIASYFKCCETGVYYSSSTSVAFIDDIGKHVSMEWIREHPGEKYFRCNECDKWFTLSQRDESDTNMCFSCAEDLRHRDDDDDDDPDNCDLINDYGSERYPAHRGKHPRKYGVEMEVEVKGSISDHAKVVLEKCVDKQGKFVILKSDGSLSHGFEIVSAPMDFNTHMTEWVDYFASGTKGLTAWDTGTCGLHIHVTRAELSHLQLGKMIVFVNDPQHASFIQTIAGRDPSRWAAFRPTWKHGKSRGRDGERYSAINLGNDDTVEFRIFRGTVKDATFYKALQFVDALVEYCGPCNRSLAETNNLENFYKYVRQHRKIYPHLDDFLVAKGYLTARKVGKGQQALATSVSE